MSRTGIIGILAVLLVIVCAFLPWSFIESRHLMFTGMNGTGSSYGEPGKLNIILSVLAIIIFAIKNRWVSRINLFIVGFLVAWTFRNMILYSRCETGECPHPGIALYVSMGAALVAMGCVLFAKSSGSEKHKG